MNFKTIKITKSSSFLQILLTPPETDEYEDITTGEPPSAERYKLVVIGDEECGKTALLNTLVKNPDFEVSLDQYIIIKSSNIHVLKDTLHGKRE